MCTLTLLRERWLRDGSGVRPAWRVVFNRDEQRSRPPATPPAVHRLGAVQALHPVDPQGGGTWIAATEHGLLFALLNGDDPATADPPGAPPRRSRGAIIPALAALAARRAADVPVRGLDPRAYRPFHLVIVDERDVIEITSDGDAIVPAVPDRADRLIRTSSSVEAAAVRAWRIARFAPPGTPASAEEQDAFHGRKEPGRPAYGVTMTRADACTVSVTTVEVFPRLVRMTYRPMPGPDAAGVTELARAS
jgi:hypothetical protein